MSFKKSYCVCRKTAKGENAARSTAGETAGEARGEAFQRNAGPCAQSTFSSYVSAALGGDQEPGVVGDV